MDKIKAGDFIHHGPTGEDWFVLGVDYKTGKLCVAGWPPTIAEIADCTFTKHNRPLREDEIAHRDKTFGGGWD